MVSAHPYHTFELSDAALLLAKTAAREQKLWWCPEVPYCPEIPSRTLYAFPNASDDQVNLFVVYRHELHFAC